MSQRKLQQEIDKVNKKINEGLTVFDAIYDKLEKTEIQSQKEKLESDLKKEIKKLQRMRDQLKTWLSSNDIKSDRDTLQTNRERIEHAMELFKNTEKNMKIKQFSNEGLNMQSNPNSRNLFNDPAQQKRQEAYEFISSIIEELSTQNESLEGKLSLLTSNKKKAANAPHSTEDLQYFLERNNEHLESLEKILKGLANEHLEPEQVDNIRDDLTYYVESNQDDEFYENELLYEELGLDDDEFDTYVPAAGSNGNGVAPDSASTVPVATTTPKEPVPAVVGAKEKEKESSPAPSSAPAPEPVPVPVPAPAPIPAPAPMVSIPIATTNGSLVQNQSNTPSLAKKVLKPVIAPVSTTPKMNFASVVAQQVSQPPPGLSKQSTLSSNSPTPQLEPAQLSITDNEVPVINHDESNSFIKELIPNFEEICSRYTSPLPIEDIKPILESSLLNCPDSIDSEKPRYYIPNRTHPTQIDYPQEPLYEISSSKIMARFDNDTLFYCFYYHQDDIFCFHAAKELIRRGWIFNNLDKNWLFKMSNKLPEPGNGVQEEEDEDDWKYFDYESWLIRRKSGFRFEKEFREEVI